MYQAPTLLYILNFSTLSKTCLEPEARFELALVPPITSRSPIGVGRQQGTHLLANSDSWQLLQSDQRDP